MYGQGHRHPDNNDGTGKHEEMGSELQVQLSRDTHGDRCTYTQAARRNVSSSRGTGPEAAPVTLQTGDACGQCLHSTVARGTDILIT